jgi:hypothetical protein
MSDWFSSGSHGAWILLAGIFAAAIVVRVVIRFRSLGPRANSRRIALEIVADRLKALRRQSYTDLLQRRTETPCATVIGPDGREYQVETHVSWDEPSKKGGNLRVMVSVDGGGAGALKPLLGSFIIGSDGSFVGEGSA